ncbi:hypothetical protein [Sphingomonas oligophenolica]|uniref:Uncharacterized protein n=1 Tax=Sphingomonas oligophenolica TaxID=301154 RepID=A0A502CN44_9SPHN|nr:hypothetical protein [Sphingomonas oligophenolica]TPG13196.1 hypothetical protein EAH84_07300 [Sphingomonas oligophenolica]
MAQIIGILLMAALAVFALKLAFIFVLIVGVIFRTKETLWLIAVLGMLALLRNYPAISYTVIAIIVIVAIAQAGKDDTKLLTDDTET